MRLIDADALIKRFEGLRDEHETLCISYVALYEVLVAQPTAYDVEKVVNQLEEQLLVVEIDDEHIIPESNVEEYFELDVVAMDDAIEIVRKGGVDG